VKYKRIFEAVDLEREWGGDEDGTLPDSSD
jgi:hypothetical protein